MEPKRAVALLTLFSDIDAATGELAAATGLRCPAACGQCCENPNVYTDPAELAPLVEHLITNGAAEAVLERARVTGPGTCIFYRSSRLSSQSPSDPSSGGCDVYPLRPSVCRLFGFAAVRDKHGTPELAACKVHGEQDPESVARARSLIAKGHPVAFFVEYQQRAAEAAGSPMAQLLPINVALAQALERALQRAAFATLAAHSHEQACAHARPRIAAARARTRATRSSLTRLSRLAPSAIRTSSSRSARNTRRPRRR
jgi:Fe-S-cluster containining protein